MTNELSGGGEEEEYSYTERGTRVPRRIFNSWDEFVETVIELQERMNVVENQVDTLESEVQTLGQVAELLKERYLVLANAYTTNVQSLQHQLADVLARSQNAPSQDLTPHLQQIAGFVAQLQDLAEQERQQAVAIAQSAAPTGQAAAADPSTVGAPTVVPDPAAAPTGVLAPSASTDPTSASPVAPATIPIADPVATPATDPSAVAPDAASTPDVAT